MRILLFGINFAPELTGIGKYTGDMAAWLASRGHDVRAVTAPPYYPEWVVPDGYQAHRYRVERWEDVRVWRCPVWVPRQPGGLARLLHLASFAASSLPAMLRQMFWKPDVVWVVEPPLFCAPTAWLVARLCGAAAWLHVQDYEADAAFALGFLRGARIHRLVLARERRLMRRFDRVSSISPRMIQRAKAKGVAPARLTSFPNWADLDSTAIPEDSASFRAELNIPPDAVVALYSGSMGRKQGLELLAQAAARLRDISSLMFVFCGNGPGRHDLAAQCAGLKNVRVIDLQPAERVAVLLHMADIHLLPQRADAADLVMPSKLAGMLASGRPVVATSGAGTELARAIEDRGLIVPPGDAEAFAAAILDLARNPEARTRLGANARAYAETSLSRDAVLAQFELELHRCVAAGPSGRGSGGTSHLPA